MLSHLWGCSQVIFKGIFVAASIIFSSAHCMRVIWLKISLFQSTKWKGSILPFSVHSSHWSLWLVFYKMTKVNFYLSGTIGATKISHFIFVNDLIWLELNTECLPHFFPRPHKDSLKVPEMLKHTCIQNVANLFKTSASDIRKRKFCCNSLLNAVVWPELRFVKPYILLSEKCYLSQFPVTYKNCVDIHH